MADPGRVPGAARDAAFGGGVPQAMALDDGLARIEGKRPHSNAPKPGAARDRSA
ncbi:MAG: hypothetical protein ACTS6J_05045 [Burkholderiales bacterium]